MADSLTKKIHPVVENWQSYSDSTPGFTAAATRNMLKDFSRVVAEQQVEIEGAHHDITSLMDACNAEVNEVERLREKLRRLAQEVVDEERRTVGSEGPSGELLDMAEKALKGLIRQPRPAQNVGTLASNHTNADHALNCPCALCEADPVRRQALQDMREAQRPADEPDSPPPL